MRDTTRRTFLASFGPFMTMASALPGLLTARTAAAQDGGTGLVEAYNACGQELFKQFASAPGNIVFSPYSIGTAMAMALAAARSDTEREMADVLKLGGGRSAIANANARALAILNGYDRSASKTCRPGMQMNGDRCEAQPQPGGDCSYPATRDGALCVAQPDTPPSARLLVADGLMLTGRGGAVSQDYVALLKDKFAAEVFQNAGLDDVNRWVSRKTEGKIDRILEQLDPMAAAVLVNAVYFKGVWAETFSKQQTLDEAFNLSASQQVRVPTMQKRSGYAVVSRPGYRAIRLPYSVGSIGMVVAVPDAIDGLPALTATLAGAELSALFASLRGASRKAVVLALPKFKSAFKTDLVPSFRQAGMKLAFDPGRADFSGMTGRTAKDGGNAIDQIVHRAVIDVYEDGTEAAAATAVGFRATSAALNPETFRIDRPFLYYIVEDKTGGILFQGRVVDPR